MSELEELRRRKIEQLQQQQQAEAAQQEQMAQQLHALELMVKQKLSKEALERYGNIKIANPEMAVQLLAVMGQIIQRQDVGVISDEQLKELVGKLTPKKREINIRRI